jgi:signal transduction histidine kinase
LVKVSVGSEAGSVVVVVQDDGIGFKAGSPGLQGCGLLGIKERVEALEGKVLISSQPSKGTTIRAQIPVEVGVNA